MRRWITVMLAVAVATPAWADEPQHPFEISGKVAGGDVDKLNQHLEAVAGNARRAAALLGKGYRVERVGPQPTSTTTYLDTSNYPLARGVILRLRQGEGRPRTVIAAQAPAAGAVAQRIETTPVPQGLSGLLPAATVELTTSGTLYRITKDGRGVADIEVTKQGARTVATGRIQESASVDVIGHASFGQAQRFQRMLRGFVKPVRAPAPKLRGR